MTQEKLCRRGVSLESHSTLHFSVLPQKTPGCDILQCLTTAALQEFVPVARELEGNWTRFTPHYIVWVCPESYRSSDECQSQCIHNGRYCTPDPDGDLQAGYSGRDIVQVHPAALSC